MKYVFSAIFSKEEHGYSVLCPELGVASQGIDLIDAERNIKEAVELFVEDLSPEDLAPYAKTQIETPLVKTFEVSHA